MTHMLHAPPSKVEHGTKSGLGRATILGDSWSAKVALWITRESRKLWLDRNEALYRPEGNQESQLEQETKANVRELYSAELKMAEVDRWLFATPIHDMLNRLIIYQAQWVARHTKLILQCVKQFEDRDKNKHADIRTYSEPKPSGTPSPIRTPMQPRIPEKTVKMKAMSLLHYFKTSITPTTRLKQAARSKARADKRKEDEKRRKSKLKDQPKLQNNMHTYYQTQDERNEDGEVALS
jgi:hypothetical protein